MRRRLDEHDFERGADARLDQMAAMRRSVAFADDHVHVQLRPFVAERDVADQ